MGIICLSIYLILVSVACVTNIPNMGIIQGVVALISAILLLAGK